MPPRRSAAARADDSPLDILPRAFESAREKSPPPKPWVHHHRGKRCPAWKKNPSSPWPFPSVNLEFLAGVSRGARPPSSVLQTKRSYVLREGRNTAKNGQVCRVTVSRFYAADSRPLPVSSSLRASPVCDGLVAPSLMQNCQMIGTRIPDRRGYRYLSAKRKGYADD